MTKVRLIGEAAVRVLDATVASDAEQDPRKYEQIPGGFKKGESTERILTIPKRKKKLGV